MKLVKKLIWIYRIITIPAKGWCSVGNRTIYLGIKNTKEVTITVRDMSKPDAYSREELLKMLRTIREHEEIMQWSVPEAIRCIYCGHCSPTDENGYCPVTSIINNQRVKCLCFRHDNGLKTVRRSTSDFTISPSEASSEALNG